MKNNLNNKFKKVVATGLAVGTVLTAGGAIVKNHKENNSKEYTIQYGDTLYDISNKYYGNGIYYKEIAKYNHIKNSDNIKVGDTIKLPDSINGTIIIENANDVLYQVQSGDSLLSICNKYYGDNSYDTALKLAKYNNISDPDKIQIGQTINIPPYDELLNMNESIKNRM